MLSSVLSRETCAKCRNCCIFEPQSAWELPTFSAESIRRLAGQTKYRIQPEGRRFRITLPYGNSGKAQPCPFLDPHSGCTLPPEEKPFACSLWPVRVMRRDDGKTALALYHGCPGVPDAGSPALKSMLDSGLRERIMQEVQKDPSLILPYHQNYTFLPGDES